MARTGKVALWVCVVGLLPGCVEMKQTITLNPDGKGKMKVEVLVPAYDFDMGAMMGGEKKKKKTTDEILKDEVAGLVKDSPGITAWKDVTASWSRDGRVNLVGTAYFERLEDLDQKKANQGPQDPSKDKPTTTFQPGFKAVIGKDGTLKISGSNAGVKQGMKLGDKEKELDVSKLNDKELDDYLLQKRIEFQKGRPFMSMMFTDLKIESVINVTGDVGEVKGFKKVGPRSVQALIDGNAFMADVKKFILLDGPAIRKLAAAKKVKDYDALMNVDQYFGETEVTVNKLGAPLFDYDKEVQAARAAYPALRKSLGLADDVKLPGDAK
jgi:hypothetical protein